MLFLHLHLVLLGQGVPKCSSITFVIQWNNMVRRCIICAFWLLLYKLYSHVTLEERQNIFVSKQQLLGFPLLSSRLWFGPGTFLTRHDDQLPSLSSGVHGLKDFLCSAHLLESFDGRIYTYWSVSCLVKNVPGPNHNLIVIF